MKAARPSTLASCLSLSLLAFWALCAAHASDEDLALQQERQKQIQAETDSMVRRLGTMLRVLEYYQIDKAGERKMVEEMAGVLSGLSKNQMAEVIRRLETASTSRDDAKSNEEVLLAYDKHREILETLKNLLSRHDAIRNLDQAADHLDAIAKGQLELHFQTAQLLRDSSDPFSNSFPQGGKGFFKKKGNSLMLEPKRQGDAQTEISQDVASVIKQVAALSAKLPDNEKARVTAMRKVATERRVVENVGRIAYNISVNPSPLQSFDIWQEVNANQWQAAALIKELARSLRATSEPLTVLREARDRVDQAITKQEEISKETPDALAKEKVRELDKDQARLQYDTRDTANLVKPVAKEISATINKAEQAMKDSREALAMNLPKEAAEPQQKATKTLEDARDELDKLIAAAEKLKNDPLAALKKAADDLEKLIKDQTQTRDQTRDAAAEKESPKTPELAKDQRSLAFRTLDLKDTPLPSKDETKDALAKAAKAMNDAAKELRNQKADNAVPKQEQALKALEEAKKQTAEKIGELEKRKEDLAKLEEAAKKLAELTKAENNIADKAKDMAAKSDANTKDLAKNQEKLTPEAKDIAKNIEAAAPEAAKKVDDSTKNMDAAKKELDKNKAKPGAAEAKEAAKKLEEAQKALAKAQQDLKAKDIADQAAMQPNKLNPEAAAQLLAKALEQTEKAKSQSDLAEKLARMEKEMMDELAKQQKRPDLIRMQEDIAKQANKMELPDPAKDASQAAQALRQADINKAIDNQQTTLDKLTDAGQKPFTMPTSEEAPKTGPTFGEAKDPKAQGADTAAQAKPNQAQPAGIRDGKTPNAAQAKSGDPSAGEAKDGGMDAEGAAQDAQAQAGQAKSGQPMQGETKAAQAQAGSAKAGAGTDALAKGGDPDFGEPEEAQAKAAQNPPLPQANNPTELAQLQKEVMDATKALNQSQNATNAAMAALGQAQAQAPKAIQKQLQNAGQQLAKANQNLQKGQPNQAGQKQNQAAKELANALKAMNAAAKGMKQPGDAQAKAGGQPGDDGDDGMGEDGKDGQGKDGKGKKGQGKNKDGQAKAGKKDGQQKGQAQEKNENLGKGDRTPDGKVSNSASWLIDNNGDGSFLHLPPRQRELIRQALSGQLPPEYAAMIQQYYINIARGRAVPGAAPAVPSNNK